MFDKNKIIEKKIQKLKIQQFWNLELIEEGQLKDFLIILN